VGGLQTRENLYPDIALSKPDEGTSKTLQLRIFRKLGVTKDFTLGEVLVSYGKACSPQLPKGAAATFSQYPRPVSTVPFLQQVSLSISQYAS
jgi:hypothetical protein